MQNYLLRGILEITWYGGTWYNEIIGTRKFCYIRHFVILVVNSTQYKTKQIILLGLEKNLFILNSHCMDYRILKYWFLYLHILWNVLQFPYVFFRFFLRSNRSDRSPPKLSNFAHDFKSQEKCDLGPCSESS